MFSLQFYWTKILCEFHRGKLVVYSSCEFNNVKSENLLDLYQLENKTYAEVVLGKMRLKLYQDFGFEIRGVCTNHFQTLIPGII